MTGEVTAAVTGQPGAHRARTPVQADAAAGRGVFEVDPDLADDPTGGPGTTRIEDKAVEKIAQQSVDDVDRASGAARHVLGVKVGSLNEDTPARVNARVDGDLVSVTVSMAVRWPSSVREVTRQARNQVTDDITRFTGMRVAEVDITVPELLQVHPQPRGLR